MSLAENIRKKRLALDLTQKELANRVQVDQSFIARVEDGTKIPGLLITVKLAEQLGCTVDELLSA